jgi:methionyl-tRNA formyltransferase
MKVLYAGSPESSAKILNSLINEGLDVVGAISQPDKRSNRGKGKEASPVSKEALRLGIPTFKPISLDGSFKTEIESLDFDFLLVSAYGKILPDWLLKSPTISPVNIHFSLLPKYRGASPIQTAILNNDKKTGISIMKMIKGMDEGPIYCFHEVEILNQENKRDLENKLTSLCIKNIAKI